MLRVHSSEPSCWWKIPFYIHSRQYYLKAWWTRAVSLFSPIIETEWLITTVSHFFTGSDSCACRCIWALLAAAGREINRERHSSLSCSVTILGQVLKETRLASWVYSCFYIRFVVAWVRNSGCMRMYTCTLKGSSSDSAVLGGVAWVSFRAVQTLHQWLLKLIKRFLPSESWSRRVLVSLKLMNEVLLWPRSIAYSIPRSDNSS